MQRKPGFPVANCNIKMPDALPVMESLPPEEEGEQLHRRQQLINFGHAQWGFNNWSWSVSKQELDFVDFSNGKYCAGVVAFVSVTVKNFDIHRENIGYATSIATNKGAAIFKSRKCAVTNALKETLLSFGGNVATELLELLEQHRELPTTVASIATVATPAIPTPAPEQENNQNVLNRPPEVKNSPVNKIRKDDVPSNMRVPVPSIKNAVPPPPPVAKALPMPCAPAPAPRPPAPPAPRGPLRPPSNVSFVVPVPALYPPPPPPPPRPHPLPHPYNYYEYSAGPWHFTYETFDRPHGNVNLNFNIPPKNLVVNSRGSVECKNACGVRQGPSVEGEPIQYGPNPQNQGCWIKPTIFYDGFWTEQKVKKWVAEQVEKQFPEDASQKSTSPNVGQESSSSK